MRRTSKVTTAAMLLLLALSSSLVFANGSPLRWGPYQMGQLLPDHSTPISVDSELLRFTLSDDLTSANVFVQYTLSNQSDERQAIKMAFALAGGKPTVKLGDTELRVEMTSATVGFLQAFALSKTRAIDPISGKPISSGYSSDRFSIALFDLVLPPRTTVPLTVQYEQKGGVDHSFANDLYTFSYLLQPASAFQSFRDLTIEMNYPTKALIGHNLPLPEKQLSDNRWLLRGQFKELPKDDFHFSVMSKEHLWFGQTKGAFYERTALVIFLSVGLLAAYGSAIIIRTRVANATNARIISAIQSPVIALLAGWASFMGISALIRVQNFVRRYESIFLFIGAGMAMAIVSLILGLMVTSRSATPGK